jgi:hypothetical protein
MAGMRMQVAQSPFRYNRESGQFDYGTPQEVEVEVDLDRIVRMVASVAVNGKSGRATRLDGLIKARRLGKPYQWPEGAER